MRINPHIRDAAKYLDLAERTMANGDLELAERFRARAKAQIETAMRILRGYALATQVRLMPKVIDLHHRLTLVTLDMVDTYRLANYILKNADTVATA